MVAGLVILSVYLLRDFAAGAPYNDEQKRYISGFLVTGLIAFVAGIYMTFTWPLPGSYNIAYGELSTFFGGIFLFLGLTIQNDWDLFGLVAYAFFVALAVITVGARIIDLGMTKAPIISGSAFIRTGLGGIVAFPVCCFFREKYSPRVVAALLLLIAAAIFALTGYNAYWEHLTSFASYSP